MRVSALIALTVAALGCPSPPVQRVVLRAEGRAPRPVDLSLAVQSEFDRAYALFADRQWAAAADAFGALVERHPDSKLVPEARYRRGVALNRLERYEEGRTQLREFLERHPTSPYARQASVDLGLAESKLGRKQDAEMLIAPVLGDLTPEERRDVEPALSEAIKEGSATLEAVRRAAKAAASASGQQRAAAEAELLRLIETRAGFLDVARLYEETRPDSPAYGLVAAKMARIAYHLGDFERARAAADRALPKAPPKVAAAVREVLARLELRGRVRPTVVGAILPLTGRFKNFGAAVEDGLKLGISRRDGIELLVRDSQGDAELAVAHVEALAKEGVVAIVGPVGVGEAGPAAARAQELGIPMILLSRAEGVTAIGPYIFRNSLTNSAQGRALARYATEVLGKKRAAVLSPELQSGEELAFAFWDALESGGGAMRGYETYAHDQTSFAQPIKRLVARNNVLERAEFLAESRKVVDAEKNPYRRKKLLEQLAGKQAPVIDFDVLLVPDYHRTVALLAPALAVEDVITNGCDEKEMERIRKTQGKTELNTVTLLGGAGWNSPELVTRGGRYVTCSVFVDGFYADSQREPTQVFVQAFQEQFERKPGLLEAQAYDTARIVRKIVLERRPATRDAFRDELAQVRKFPGATGETTFGPDREADKPLFFLTIDKTGLAELDVNISPAGLAAPAARTEAR